MGETLPPGDYRAPNQSVACPNVGEASGAMQETIGEGYVRVKPREASAAALGIVASIEHIAKGFGDLNHVAILGRQSQ